MSRRGGWNPPTAALWSVENDWEQRCHEKFVVEQHLLSHETFLHTFKFRYLFHSTLPIQDFFPRRLQTSVPVYEGVSSLFIYIYFLNVFFLLEAAYFAVVRGTLHHESCRLWRGHWPKFLCHESNQLEIFVQIAFSCRSKKSPTVLDSWHFRWLHAGLSECESLT